ncbi:MAG: ribosome-binding factor A [Flammeovirgaceae bacterium]|nr:ribosome-binding factor A [Flammeovirgaceae bacterium]MBE60779.1 ribosome-binding factor A [Flammeovirgaceae bacterium]HCX25038.1 30S ribosome-binding factor RbfA [Cytophagales bacterium]|tara:strand:- start:171 stop:551 length:381 start_codon:yes stop_codon:yes gene_type:complete
MTQSKRQVKFGRQIQKDLGEIFQKDPRHYFGNSLVTVTGVEMSPDLSLARVYLSVFPIKDAEDVFFNLDEKKSEVRRHLGNKIGKQVRIVPEIAFFHDNTEEEASKMDRLIDGLNIPPADENDEEE